MSSHYALRLYLPPALHFVPTVRLFAALGPDPVRASLPPYSQSPTLACVAHGTSERARIATVRSKEAHPHSGRQQQHKAGGPPHHGHIPEAGGAARSAATSIGACERAWSEQKSSVKEAPQDLQHPRRRWLAAARGKGAMTGGDATAIACLRTQPRAGVVQILANLQSKSTENLPEVPQTKSA